MGEVDRLRAAAGERPGGVRRRLAAELVSIFGVLPALFLLSPITLPKIPCLLAAAAYGTVCLLREPGCGVRRLCGPWPRGFFRRTLPRRAAAAAAVIAAAVLALRPEAFLAFPAERTRVWLGVTVLYPVLSALPQELLYRAFFFQRYRRLFPGERALGWASAAAFAYLHIVFLNPVAPLLTLPAGLIFADTYRRSGSLPAVAIEHAIYGNLVFTLGLGEFFYRGL